MITLISVTQDDINRGYRNASRSCPVARAIERKLNLLSIVAADTEYLHIQTLIRDNPDDPTLARRHGETLRTPANARAFIYQFDGGYSPDNRLYFEIVQPFTFSLDIPPEFLLSTPGGNDA